MPRSFPRSGFTLVELSIVLVILGLLVGGVLSGQSLIHAAELRSISKENAQYQTAVNAFRDKYFALPGDMKNAVSFWGAADGALADGLDADCLAIETAAVGTETCNGDGNGKVATDGGAITEGFRFWQHLTNAGLVEGSYSGVGHTGGAVAQVRGINVPASRFPRAVWSFADGGPVGAGNINYFPMAEQNFYFFGAATADVIAETPVMKPEDAYNIDKKMDDGLPGTGTITTRRNAALPNCVASGDASYLLDGTTTACYLYFASGH